MNTLKKKIHSHTIILAEPKNTYEMFRGQQESGHDAPQVDTAKLDSYKHVVSDGNNLPEVYQHTYPEVAPENFPEHIDTSSPEVVPPSVRDQKEIAGASTERTICGLRRKTFWIVLAVILLIIIAAAVGGGVGGAMAMKKSNGTNDSNPSGDSSTSSSSGGDDSSSPPSSSNTLLPTTRLASLNYTDADGTENHHVYYQLANKHIYGSAWNSSAPATWRTFAVSTEAGNIRNNTPLSASVYWWSASRRDFRVYWLAPDNTVVGVISGYDAPLGPYSTSSIADEGFVAGANSSIASYGRACADCANANLVLFQDAEDRVQVVLRNQGWKKTAIAASATGGAAMNGTDIALGGVWSQSATKYVSLYVAGGEEGNGNVTRLLWDGSDWLSDAELGAGVLPVKVDVDAPRLAAFEVGYNDTASFAARVVGGKAAGGVEVAAWDGDAGAEWARNTVETSSSSGSRLEMIAAGSSLAANQAGRVYGLVANGSLGEWAWSKADGFSFAGWVDTTVE